LWLALVALAAARAPAVTMDCGHASIIEAIFKTGHVFGKRHG